MSTKVDISGLDKVDLLYELWSNTSPASFFNAMPHIAPEFDAAEARKAIHSYVDYFCGRCIKCDLCADSVNPHSYDRDAGDGAFAKIVERMRRTAPAAASPGLPKSAVLHDDTDSDDSSASDDEIVHRGGTCSVSRMDMGAPLKNSGKVIGFKCANGRDEFLPFGKAMIPGDEGTVLCAHCPYMRKQHTPIYEQ